MEAKWKIWKRETIQKEEVGRELCGFMTLEKGETKDEIGQMRGNTLSVFLLTQESGGEKYRFNGQRAVEGKLQTWGKINLWLRKDEGNWSTGSSKQSLTFPAIVSETSVVWFTSCHHVCVFRVTT